VPLSENKCRVFRICYNYAPYYRCVNGIWYFHCFLPALTNSSLFQETYFILRVYINTWEHERLGEPRSVTVFIGCQHGVGCIKRFVYASLKFMSISRIYSFIYTSRYFSIFEVGINLSCKVKCFKQFILFCMSWCLI